jgi:hypothetical protein
VCLEELEGGANVVKVTPIPHRTHAHDAATNPVGLMGWLTTLVCDTPMALVEAAEVFGPRQLDMRNSGLVLVKRSSGRDRDGVFDSLRECPYHRQGRFRLRTLPV